MLRRLLSKAPRLFTRSSGTELVVADRTNIYNKYDDTYCMHRMRIGLEGDSFATPALEGLRTRVSWNCFIAPCATLVGNVEIWDYASIFYGTVIKADVNLVRIGFYANVQDNVVIHEALKPLSLDHDGSTIVGHYVTVGQGSLLQGCTIEDESLVGMGCILEEDSYMEKHTMLGAGSILKRGSRIPHGELWVGRPAKFFRKLSQDEIWDFKNRSSAAFYLAMEEHKREFYLPLGTQYQEAEKCGYKIGWIDEWHKDYVDRKKGQPIWP